jgi:hypothetical protein
MCDTIGGELIVCFPRADLAAREIIGHIRHEKIDHVTWVESLDQRLGRMGLRVNEGFPFEMHLVRVPNGSEAYKISYLQFFYKHELFHFLTHEKPAPEFAEVFSRSDYQFTVIPNSYLSTSGRPLAPKPVRAAGFHFSNAHNLYREMLGLPTKPPLDLDKIKILILDTGVAADAKVPGIMRKNFVDPKNSEYATDDHGHGTAVALIIHNLAPTTELIIYKVADASGRASEWDTLAALAADSGAHIVNVSLSFGLGDAECPVCGRESKESRSAVFENTIGQIPKRMPAPVLIAAAGNLGRSELSFPARFAEVLAISSMTSKHELSSFSNFGENNQVEQRHENRFAAPGGESRDPNKEYVGSFDAGGGNVFGTSFSAAYASGLLANVWAQQGLKASASDVVTVLKNHSIRQFSSYDSTKFGNGIVHF